VTDLSVIIVSYNVREILASCLLSLDLARNGMTVETYVVDNASDDLTVEMVRERFPWVTVIASPDNLGFAKANNLALEKASGRHLMILNPDTILKPDSLSTLVTFLDDNPEYGAVGPKLLNENGTYQASGKRSIPTPWSSFSKLSGLSSAFPRCKFFTQYQLGYLHEDKAHDVGALCGCAMVVRREAYEAAGGLDETYFMYGEDIAWCDAIRRAGWEIRYLPDAPIMHLKGQSTKQDEAAHDRHFFDAMKIFYRHRMGPGATRRFMMDSGIELAKFASMLRRTRRFWRAPLIDGGLMAGLVWLLLPLLGFSDPAVGPLLIASPVVILGLLGAYRAAKSYEKHRVPFHIATAIIFAFLALAGYFLFDTSNRAGLFLVMWAGFGWVLLGARRIVRTLSHLPNVTVRSVIAGSDDVSRDWLRARFGDNVPKDIWGWALWGGLEDAPTDDEFGLEVIARVEDLPVLAKQKRIKQVLFSAQTATYDQILTFLEHSPMPGVRVRIIDESTSWPVPVSE
jgi:GT2 family glycosyltransferase